MFKTLFLGCLFVVSTSSFAQIAPDPAPLKTTVVNNVEVFTDQNGLTVYTFDPDLNDPGHSTCNGSCITAWPAVPAPTFSVSAPYSVIMRDDGSKQLARNGSPVYTFGGDKNVGDTKGDGLGGVWHIIKVTP